MHIHTILDNLAKEFFDPQRGLTIDLLEQIYENSYATDDGESKASEIVDDNGPQAKGTRPSETIYGLRMVQHAMQDFKCVDLLQEIAAELREARTKGGFYNNPNDSWEILSEYMSVEQYLCFTFAMVGLAEFDAISVINRKLSFAAARAYFLLLTTPGAKRCKAFDERVILKCFNLFNFLQQIKHPTIAQQLKTGETNEIQLQFVSILDDFHTIFKIVSLEDYANVKEELIKTLKNIILFNHINGYDNTYSYNLSMKSYEIFEIVCLPIHGDVTATMYTILSNTSALYKYNNGPARHGQIQVPEKAAHGDTIADFFIYLLDKFSNDTVATLTRFIQSLISNADDDMKPEDYSHLLDIGIKYEAAMFSKCNVSLVPWLEQAALSSDVTQRANATEFLGRMLTASDSKVEWVLFQGEISDIPREIHILKVLLVKVVDVHNTLKQKSLAALIKAFSSGNKTTIRVLDAAFNTNGKTTRRGKGTSPLKRNPNTIAEEIRGLDLLTEEVQTLPRKLFHLLQNNNLAHIRRSSMVLLEILAERNRDLLNDSIFIDVISEISEDPTPLVRKQLVPFFNKMLKVYPNHKSLIEIWVKCLLILLNDADVKIVEISMDSLKVNIFDNIVRYEDSSSERTFMPWIILRSILKFGNRNILRNAVDSWISNKFLTSKTLSVIESHIYTANCTEAWVLLSLIANKMQSRNPDMIVRAFSDLVQFDMYNSSLNLHLILEVIKAWLMDFSRSALNHIYNMLNDLLLTGSSNSSLVTYIYDVCASVKKMVDSDSKWIERINNTARDFILQNRENFLYDHNDERFYNYLLIFSDSNADLPHQPDEQVLAFMVDFLAKASEPDSVVSQITDADRKICIVVVTSCRLAIRDTDIAAQVIPLYAQLLKISIRENIVSNCIISLSDLCKKHTSLVEPTIQEVVNKLKSNNNRIRHTALKHLRELLMQDYIKMRGRVLLNILTAIVDSCDEIANESASIILGYVEEKNKLLLNTCFLESVFVYNNYLQFDGFEMFPVSEIDNEPSVLQGPRKIDKRFTLYKFFIDNIDEVNLLLLLKHVNLIYDKLKKGTFIKCDEGIYTLKDLLYIFKNICDTKSRRKVEKDDGDSDVPPDSPVKPAVGARGAPTMAIAMAMVEKVIQIVPKLDAAVRAYDPSIGIFQDRFNEAIVANFKQMVEFAQPQAFWQAIREKLKDVDRDRRSKQRKHRKAMSNAGSVCGSEFDADSDGVTDVTDYESACGDEPA